MRLFSAATAGQGPSTARMPDLLQPRLVLCGEIMRGVRRDQGDVGGVAAQEHRLGDAVPAAADHAHLACRSPHSRRRSGNSGSARAPALRRAAPRPSAAAGWSRRWRAARSRAVTGPDPHSAPKPPSARSSRVTRPVSIEAPYLRPAPSSARAARCPKCPSGKPAWLRVQGIRLARLLPASTTFIVRWKRAR